MAPEPLPMLAAPSAYPPAHKPSLMPLASSSSPPSQFTDEPSVVVHHACHVPLHLHTTPHGAAVTSSWAECTYTALTASSKENSLHTPSSGSVADVNTTTPVHAKDQARPSSGCVMHIGSHACVCTQDAAPSTHCDAYASATYSGTDHAHGVWP